ncbi:MAG: hypothetical protein GY797_11245 [Deltaproteobacteria bacterium]|nr:hypothetical protein [Deltaproteobacteria bacterium]
MTYIIQYQQKGVNAIISDTRITWNQMGGKSVGYNSYLKTGHLYPGCMYGIIGNTQNATDFIQSFTLGINHDESLAYLWERFRVVVSAYSFLKGVENSFLLLLSFITRDRPLFFVLDSERGILTAQKEGANIVETYGSGKSILDDFIFTQLNPKLESMQEFLETQEDFSKELIHKISPYFICQQLNELALTSERMYLEHQEVGGPFHFISQTNNTQKFQAPAVYILSFPNKNKRTIASEFYRVAFPNNMMYIEKITSLKTKNKKGDSGVSEYFLINTSSNPNFIGLNVEAIIDIGRKGLIGMDYWSYLGIGRANPNNRKHIAFKLKKGGKLDDIIDSQGILRKNIQELIEKGF